MLVLRAGGVQAFYTKYGAAGFIKSEESLWQEPTDAQHLNKDYCIETMLGKYAIDACRIDLIPSVALERLGLHNELCALKW